MRLECSAGHTRLDFGSDTFLLSCPVCDKDAEIAALRTRVEALTGALRRKVIFPDRCVQCGFSWIVSGIEKHNSNCLAAPEKEVERG